MSAPSSIPGYRPDIDGLRAVAVLSVLLFHCGVAGISGGFVGVDVFFVISGYVIALTLMRDLNADAFSIRKFYERRVRRLFPALIFIFALSWIAAWLLFLPTDFDDFSASLTAAATFVSNLYFWRYSGYFNNEALLRPLLHTWSLSVEEQFYIFAPIAMYVCYRYLNKRYMLMLVPAIVLSLGLSVYASDFAPTANFFLLPTRAWELLFGVVIAVARPPKLSDAARTAAAIAGLALIAHAVFGYTKFTPFPGLSAIPPCLGAALIIWAGSGGTTPINRALAWKPVVAVGLISYSLYLVHWPLIVFTRYATLRDPTATEIAAIIVASFILATFSWRYIEQPFRHPDRTPNARPLLYRGVAAMTVVALAGGFGMVTNGAEWRFPREVARTIPDPNTWKTGTCFQVGDIQVGNWDLSSCTRTSGGTSKVLLWGDSYAAHYIPGLEAAARSMPVQIVQYTAAGCPPVLSYYSYARPGCGDFNRRAIDIIRENGIKTVILSARWVDLQQRGLDSIQSTLEELKRMDVEAWVIGQSPIFPANVRLIAYKNKGNGERADYWPSALDKDINPRLRTAAEGAHFIDPLKFLCNGELCRYREDEQLLYTDSGHFSEKGSVLAVQDYFPLLARERSANAEALTR